MSWIETRLTGVVKRHDPKLFVQRNFKGVLQVLRENYVLHPYEVDDRVIHCLSPAHYYVMALTDTWGANGNPVEWGVEPILQRLKMIDCWSSQSFVSDEMEKQNDKADRSKERDLMNRTEAAAYEMHSSFKKTFSDVNTANMNKIDLRRKKGA